MSKAINQSNVRAFAFNEQAAIQKPATFASAYEFAKINMKKPTKRDAQRLRIGDVIEVYYADQKEPRLEVVIQPCGIGFDISSVRTISRDAWIAGGARHVGLGYVNSEYFKKVGTMVFNVSRT